MRSFFRLQVQDSSHSDQVPAEGAVIGAESESQWAKQVGLQCLLLHVVAPGAIIDH